MLLSGITNFLKNGFRYRHLILRLTQTKLGVQFKRSRLGSFWVFFTPLTTVAVWFFLHSAGMLRSGDTGAPYLVYLLAGVTIFNLFATTFEMVSRCITENTNVILDVTVARDVFVFEKLVNSCTRFAILFTVAILFMLMMGYSFTSTALLTPLFLFPLVITALAAGIVFSLLRVVLVDVALLADKLVGLLIFITPVFYTRHIRVPLVRTLVDYNPVTYLVGIPRDVLLFGHLPSWSVFFTLSVVSVFCLIIALHVFEKSNSLVMEKLLV